jgi:hypothetical protein
MKKKLINFPRIIFKKSALGIFTFSRQFSENIKILYRKEKIIQLYEIN